jgi:hemolysin activation/secretion protein
MPPGVGRTIVSVARAVGGVPVEFPPADQSALELASLSGERMLPSMQSILGGASGVRGYPEACVAGDQAFLFSLEYQWKFFSSGAWGLTLAPFLDYGKTYIHDLMPHEAENTLASWGIGLGIHNMDTPALKP